MEPSQTMAPATARDASPVLGVSGTRFTLDGADFPFTGLSFFNALHNPAFNAADAERRDWLRRFAAHGINVVRVWGQWDSRRGFVDTSADATLYRPDGTLNDAPLARLHALLSVAAEERICVELALFSQESWHDGIRLAPDAATRAVQEVTRATARHRNLAIQIWNEFDERALEHAETVKATDAARLVTNSSGVAGVLLAQGRGEVERRLDFLTPHTSRQHDGAIPHWRVAPAEIGYLLARFRKPVVDDEPARNGTPDFGGPKTGTDPMDQILQIQAVWDVGGYVVYHHDMFQTGAGSGAVPPSGIPDPEHNPYHRQVLSFLAKRERYMHAPWRFAPPAPDDRPR